VDKWRDLLCLLWSTWFHESFRSVTISCPKKENRRMLSTCSAWWHDQMVQRPYITPHACTHSDVTYHVCVQCCLSPDIVFFIYLYQRWIYRVDPKRVNEFGTSGEDAAPSDSSQKESEDVGGSLAIGDSPAIGSGCQVESSTPEQENGPDTGTTPEEGTTLEEKKNQ